MKTRNNANVSGLTWLALTAESEALLAELRESPLPGARYAYTVVRLRLAAIEAAAVAAHVRETGCEGLDDMEKFRMDRGWPTPNQMRTTADALDRLTRPALYGDALRWVADLCDAALAAREEAAE